MKKLFLATLALTAMTALTACHHHDDPEEVTAGRTVLIYMAGENNLTTFADEDLQEIKAGVPTIGDNNLIIYVDQADYSTKPYYLCYHNGELQDSIPTETDDLTSDAATLEKVARKAFKDYPAKSYGLVLWGHASGWLIRTDSVSYTSLARKKAYGGDTGNNTSSSSGKTWMNIPSMAKALSKVEHLSFIFADCCNFMCLESAYELRNVTDYLIGSPAEIPGVGAPYNTIVPALFETNTFYTSIVDKYYAQRAEGYDEPLSVIKTSEMDNLASATRTVLKTFAGSFGSDYPDMSGLIHYYYDLTNRQQFYDANHFILTYASTDNYRAWKQALDKAVIYKKMAKEWMTRLWPFRSYYGDFEMNDTNYGGVSMFVPVYPSRYTDNEYIKKMGWYYAAGYNEIGW